MPTNLSIIEKPTPGDAELMIVRKFRMYIRGQPEEWIYADLCSFKMAIKQWADGINEIAVSF